MNRRKFLKISAATAGAAIIGGGTFYTRFKDSDPLSPFFAATQKVFLVRYNTIAEGAEKCDFRFKKGRETFVYPLRKGWPPNFHNDDTELSQ